VIEEDDGDDDDSEGNGFEFGDDATPDATKPAAVSKMVRPLLLMTSMKKVCHRIL
jgi:hypothetical protein